ncbi:uncharacterized protein LOC127012515 [Drosophila biarmipes]|uniref:uncharacterized protein LOC127012515 n=1 Tax=Drosophila biarmipes TaxID=125945 RepID=UPI0007E8056A|nr:uncharacterized protein LOC127012515 [Drosophila biarmipes]
MFDNSNHKMSKYFNTEILKTLVAQAPVDGQDICNDRFAAMEKAGQYLLFVSSDPKKELHPQKVKTTLRQLFQAEVKEHGCIVRIREETAHKDQGQAHEEQKIPQEEDYDEDSVVGNTKRVERARGGLNITYDPKMLSTDDSWTNWPDRSRGKLKVLHRNPNPLSSSQSSEDWGGSKGSSVYVSLDEYIKMKDTRRPRSKSPVRNQKDKQRNRQKNEQKDEQKVEPKKSQKSEKDPPENRQLAEVAALQTLLKQLFQRCSEHMNNLTEFLKEFMDQPHKDNLTYLLREFVGLPQRSEGEDGSNLNPDAMSDDSDDEGMDWLSQNPFTSAHRISVPESSRGEDSPSRLKRFRVILQSCIRSVREFFSTWDQESFRSWLDREDPLFVGHSGDPSFLLLVDRLMLAVKWATKLEELQAATRVQPEQVVLDSEREQQLRNEPNFRRVSSRSLTRLKTLLNSVDPHSAQPLYLVTQSKGRQC